MNILEDKIWKLIWKIGFPAMIGMFFVTMYNFTDTYFASQITDQNGVLIKAALAGVAASFPIFMAINALSSGFQSATGALVGEQIGAKNIKKAQEIIYHVAILTTISSIIVGVTMIFLTPGILNLMGVDSEVASYATQYIYVLLGAILVFSFSSVMGQILNIQGQTKLVRNSLIIGFFANILLDYLFIKVIPMAAAGLAIATVLVQFIQASYVTYYVFKSDIGKGLWRKYTFNKKYIGEIFALAIPASFSVLIVSVGIFLLNKYANQLDPEFGVSAVGIGFRIEQVFLILLFGGIGPAMMAIGSQALGAHKFDRLKELYTKSLILGIGILLIASVVMYVFANQLASIFTSSNSELTAATVEYLRIEAFTMPAYALLTVPATMLTIMKKPNVSLAFNFSRQLIAPFIIYPIFISAVVGPKSLWWAVFGNNWIHGIIAVIVCTFLIQQLINKGTKQYNN